MKRYVVLIAIAVALMFADKTFGQQCVGGVCSVPAAATFRPMRNAPRAIFAPIVRRPAVVQYAPPVQSIPQYAPQYAAPPIVWNDPQPVYQPRTYRVFRQPLRGTCVGGVCR